ncbi:MAG: zinc-binding dehydrogenase [Puniceicoccaceae bacterium]
MKAAYYIGNKTFQLEDVDPVEPAADEVRVKVAYCGICGTDLHAFHGAMDARIGNHRVIGHEMSGTVDKVGEAVEGIEPGEAVVIRPLKPCGECPACKRGHAHICHNLKFLGMDSDGAFQQYWTVPAYTVHKVPDGVSLQHAALIEPLAVACHDIKRSRLAKGEDVLVIGGGPIGLLMAMVAKEAGGNVVISEVSEHRLAVAEKLGFTTINPVKDDVAARIFEMTADKGADVIFEVSGSQAGIATMTDVAATRARVVLVAIFPKKPEVDMFRFFWREIELLGARVYQPDDYDRALELIASGAIACEEMITDVQGIESINEAFNALSGNPQAMKSLIKCS